MTQNDVKIVLFLLDQLYSCMRGHPKIVWVSKILILPSIIQSHSIFMI